MPPTMSRTLEARKPTGVFPPARRMVAGFDPAARIPMTAHSVVVTPAGLPGLANPPETVWWFRR